MHRQIAGRLTGSRTKWLVLVGWIVVLAAAGPFAGKLIDVQDNDSSSWLPASAESTEALERLAPFQDENDIPTALVYESDDGPLSQAQLAEVREQLAEVGALDGVVGDPVGPVVSEDGEVAESLVSFNFGSDGWNRFPDVADELRDIGGEVDGTTFYVAGGGGQAADAAEAFGGIDSTLLIATLSVVVLILLLTYRSPVLWLLPIMSALVALTVTEAVVYFLAKDAGLTVNGQTQGILTVLVIGAGTDYALLLVARYREELRRHADRHEAMAVALHRAAPAVLASAATVALGLLCLLLADMNSTAGLGPVLAIGVTITLLVMVTLLPALLVIVGRWVFWPKRPDVGSDEPTAHGVWARVGRGIAPRPRLVWVVTALVLGAACLGVLRLDTGGLSTDQQYTQEFESVAGQRVLDEHGLADSSNPVMVVSDAEHADDVAEAMRGVYGLGTVNDQIPPVDGTALVTATVPGDPAAQGAFDLVEQVRDAVGGIDGADVAVGGGSAIFYDIQQASARDNLVVIPAILLVVLLILMVLLRAVVAPLLLMGTVVLSFGAALGISTLIFHEVFARVFAEGEGFRHADASFPLFVFVFLVALGIDYNIFLMSRVREETATLGTRAGSLVALRATGGVITSAGLVLAATFAVLGTLPLVFLAELGTAVALGVVLDTLVVRSVLVTALNLDLGGRIWWPSRLDRAGHEVVPPAGTDGTDGTETDDDEREPVRA